MMTSYYVGQRPFGGTKELRQWNLRCLVMFSSCLIQQRYSFIAECTSEGNLETSMFTQVTNKNILSFNSIAFTHLAFLLLKAS